MEVLIREINKKSKYLDDLIKLEKELWEEESLEDLYDVTLNSKGKFFGAFYLDELVGFIFVSIRNDYVEGCNTSPAGYIEGIFVKEEYRKKGIAKKLLEHSYLYFKENNISEVGSDVLIDNINSQRFHEAVGFKEVEKIVCYVKKI